MKLVIAQLRFELVTLLRNYEQLLLVVVIPIGVLLFFGGIDVLPGSAGISHVVAAVLTLAVMSTAMVSTGIATGFERSYQVLKRLGATPLGRTRLVWAKAGAVGVVEIGQAMLLVSIALLLGWSADAASWWRVVMAMLFGTTAFAGIGLALAGRLRAEVNLAAQNGLYLVLLAVGGVVVPLDELPASLQSIARLLPSGALADVLSTSLNGGDPSPFSTWIVLITWAIAMPLLAARVFRFEG